MTDDLVKRLRNPPFGTETSERILMCAASDRIESLTTRVTELEGLLREAREDLGAYVEADYPEHVRAAWPDIHRRWNRDMGLCRRIDEALNTGDDNE